MPKLNPKAQIKLRRATLTLILKNYNLKLISFKIAKGGIENTTALVTTDKGRFALRVYRKNKKKIGDIKQELEFMLYLQKHDLPVPTVFANTHGALVTEFKIQGNTWKSVLMELMNGVHAKTYSDALIKDYAQTQARMHKLGMRFAKSQPKRKKLDTLKEGEFIKNIKLHKLEKQEVLDILQRAKNFIVRLDNKLPRGFNHLDYDHANTLVKNNKLSAILDFDDLTYSPVVVCLSYTLWDVLYTTNSKLELQKFRLYLKEYQKIRTLKSTEVRYLKDIMIFRNYVIGALEVMFWGENAKYVKTFLRLEKLLQNIKIADYI